MALTWTPLSLQTKPVDPTVDGGAQVRQAVNIECVSDFTEAPVLNIQFRWVVPGRCVLAEPRRLCRAPWGPGGCQHCHVRDSTSYRVCR